MYFTNNANAVILSIPQKGNLIRRNDMKKYLAMLLACAMIFAFAAGCAQQNPTNSDEPTATNAPTDVEATPVQNTELVTDGNETVSDKDTINIAVDREPATLNPGGVSSNVNEIIMRNVLDTLLKFDENAIPQANLATEWEAIDDLLSLIHI